MARTRIDDVAAHAGVSIKTVSRVMNDEPGVRAETRDRVRAIMSALNYHPSLPARSLAGRRSNLLGLIYDNPSASYVFDVQKGAMARCREANLRLFVLSCNDLGELSLPEVLAMAEQTHVDGLILTPPLSANHELIASLEARGLPFVRVAPDDFEHASPRIEFDDAAAAREMTDHLIGLGHRRIAFIFGHPDHYNSHVRLKGFRDAVEASRLPADGVIVEQGYNTVRSGVAAAMSLLKRPDRPTAIIASNSDMAAGVSLATYRLGIQIPRDLSLACFDDSYLSDYFWPPVSAILESSYEIAYAATDLLIRMVRRAEVPPATLLKHDFVVRESTGPVPA